MSIVTAITIGSVTYFFLRKMFLCSSKFLFSQNHYLSCAPQMLSAKGHILTERNKDLPKINHKSFDLIQYILCFIVSRYDNKKIESLDTKKKIFCRFCQNQPKVRTSSLYFSFWLSKLTIFSRLYHRESINIFHMFFVRYVVEGVIFQGVIFVITQPQ